MDKLYVVLAETVIMKPNNKRLVDDDDYSSVQLLGVFNDMNKVEESINKIRRKIKEERPYVNTDDITFDILEYDNIEDVVKLVRCYFYDENCDYGINEHVTPVVNNTYNLVYVFDKYGPYSNWFDNTYYTPMLKDFLDAEDDEDYDDWNEEEIAIRRKLDEINKETCITDVNGDIDEQIFVVHYSYPGESVYHWVGNVDIFYDDDDDEDYEYEDD